MYVLAGDIGGTNCRLSLFNKGLPVLSQTVSSQNFSTLWPVIQSFLKQAPGRPTAACLGVAGAVLEGQAHLTNLGWALDAAVLSEQLGAPVRLINDFHAIAMALPELTASDYVALGPEPGTWPAPIAVIGPGTGLGEAIVVPHNGQWVVVPGEGSHKRFAPRDARDWALLASLQAQFGEHISVERVVSGPGLEAIYTHLAGETLTAAVITQRVLEGTCPVCTEVLDIFIGVFADEAASLALQCNAGVVYLAGGISPRIIPLLQAHFRGGFIAKGRYKPWLESVAVRVITHPDPGRLGAARVAEMMAAG